MDYGLSASYLVAICVADRIPAFGEVLQIGSPVFHPSRIAPPYSDATLLRTEPRSIATLHFTRLGQAVYEFWKRIPEFHPYVDLDALVIMPDHIHGILHFKKENTRAGVNPFGPQKKNLASRIRGCKSGLTMLAQELNAL